MNKYRDALYRLDDGEHTIEDFELLKKLAKEKDEQESRKDKLVVGSEWECVYLCFGRHSIWNIEDVCQVTRITENGVGLSNEDYMPKDQFLICFKPK